MAVKIDAGRLDFKELGRRVRECPQREIEIRRCNGQRYIASGLGGKKITIRGTPGNALGAYLDGCKIEVFGNAQEAVGDTMNDGSIVIHGSAGDAAGYAMRGGTILVQGDTGYRAGIHMKAYRDKVPALVVGGRAGSFLGEYQAGGVIVVLGIGSEDRTPVGHFCAAGMHGGKIFLRTQYPPRDLPRQVNCAECSQEELEEAEPVIRAFCAAFGCDAKRLLEDRYCLLTPNTQSPYRQLYTQNEG